MLEIKGVTKSFYNQEVLRNINYSFKENRVYFIVGESGCGKTTLLKILSGIDFDYEGIVLFNGNDINELTKEEKANYYTGCVSYISQFPVCFQEITSKENIDLSKYVNRKSTYIFGSFLNKLKLKKKSKQLSLGEKQRVCIQRILNQNAKIILADEPTAALDNQYKTLVIEELIRRTKDKILIIVTHDLELAKLYADEIIEIKNGKIKSNKNKEKIEIKSIEKVNKNISSFSAFKFAKSLYKSERKKSLLYNYSLVIGIVLMSFTNMLSEGMMNYFKDQLTIDNSQNTIEYFYDYNELFQEDLIELCSDIGSKYFNYNYKTNQIEASLTIDDKNILVPSYGLVNYKIDNELNENEIEIILNEEINSYLTNEFKFYFLGMDFIQYINEFTPTVCVNYFLEEENKNFSLSAIKASVSNDDTFTFVSKNKDILNTIVSFFNLDYDLSYNGLVDDKFIEFVSNQNEIFIKDNKLYKQLNSGLVEKEIICFDSKIEYGNVDFSFENLIINDERCVCFEYNNLDPDYGRPSENKQEIIVSSSLYKKLFQKDFAYETIEFCYEEKFVEFNIVGIVNNEESVVYYTQKNYEHLLDLFNSFSNYRKFPVKETLFLKSDLDYNQLLEFADKQTSKIDSSIIEVLQGMVPTLNGIKVIMQTFSIFTICISLVTLLVLTILDFESKQKEYLMLKQTGYKKKDIVKINMFKMLFSSSFVVLFSVCMIEVLKVFMNRLLGQNLHINSMFSGYDYLSNVLSYTLISFVLSNLFFAIYTKRLTKN